METFDPIPEIGKKYKTKDDDTIIVKNMVEDAEEGICYECASEKAPDVNILFGAKEWNDYVVGEVSATKPPLDEGSTDNSKQDTSTTDDNKTDNADEPTDTDSQEPYHSSVITPDGKFSPDAKINELAGLLEAGPTRFNQKFFPTDEDLPENNLVDKESIEGFQNTLDDIEKQRDRGRDLKGKISKVNEFLWICAGVDRDLLRTCATDWAKKVGLGGTILATSVLATLSMGYAALTVASIGAKDGSIAPYVIAVVLGIVWGLVIFNLDRYLVNSMYSDGTSKITKEEFKSGLPRIIIAFFLGIIISTPIELKIFEDEINKQITAESDNSVSSYLSTDLTSFNATANRLKTDYEKADKELIILQNCIAAEEQGLQYNRSTGEILKDEHGISLKNPRGAGNGEEYKSLKKREPNMLRKRDSLKLLYDTHMAQENELITQSKNDSKTILAKQMGFSKRLGILLTETSIIRHPDKPLSWARLLIAILFIILEILPVFNKMMQENGQYDKILILESKTREQLERIKEFNNINKLRPGPLAPYLGAIIGHDIKEDENHNEGNYAFIRKDIRRENKDETEQDSQEIYRYARQKAKEHVLHQIDIIFQDEASKTVATNPVSKSTSQPNVEPTTPEDPSSGAETIA